MSKNQNLLASVISALESALPLLRNSPFASAVRDELDAAKGIPGLDSKYKENPNMQAEPELVIGTMESLYSCLHRMASLQDKPHLETLRGIFRARLIEIGTNVVELESGEFYNCHLGLVTGTTQVELAQVS